MVSALLIRCRCRRYIFCLWHINIWHICNKSFQFFSVTKSLNVENYNRKDSLEGGWGDKVSTFVARSHNFQYYPEGGIEIWQWMCGCQLKIYIMCMFRNVFNIAFHYLLGHISTFTSYIKFIQYIHWYYACYEEKLLIERPPTNSNVPYF